MKKIGFFIFLMLFMVFAGCSYSSHFDMDGKNVKNSTKVQKIKFVKEYLDDYKQETVITSSDGNGLNARVYFKNVPDTETHITFKWINESGDSTSAKLTINQSNAAQPAKAYLTTTNPLPAGKYTLEVYLTDTGDKIGSATIEVVK
ncbi:hypothetical protein MK805_11765 [Shimazuella sp. AN120528]|uniref:hypothetical protein n=1 Tax=Shimazuella soli TaxID=1892854 RepID=UPI001F106A65|nr:hypothetical protein [Shimazuella soli]MCH5585621.1 hypothetical protein [Shimazuella soli]